MFLVAADGRAFTLHDLSWFSTSLTSPRWAASIKHESMIGTGGNVGSGSSGSGIPIFFKEMFSEIQCISCNAGLLYVDMVSSLTDYYSSHLSRQLLSYRFPRQLLSKSFPGQL